jgi:hypothetical protein
MAVIPSIRTRYNTVAQRMAYNPSLSRNSSRQPICATSMNTGPIPCKNRRRWDWEIEWEDTAVELIDFELNISIFQSKLDHKDINTLAYLLCLINIQKYIYSRI